jgi:hypothetical protein
MAPAPGRPDGLRHLNDAVALDHPPVRGVLEFDQKRYSRRRQSPQQASRATASVRERLLSRTPVPTSLLRG